jgi:hypothetical protein
MFSIFYPIYVGIIYLPPTVTFLRVTRRSAPDQIQLYKIVL